MLRVTGIGLFVPAILAVGYGVSMVPKYILKEDNSVKRISNLPTKTIQEVNGLLASRIKPYFDRGDLDFCGVGGVAQQNGAGDLRADAPLLRNNKWGENCLVAGDINFPFTDTKYYTHAIKQATFYFDDVIEVSVVSLRCAHVYVGYKHSVFSNKRYQVFSSVTLPVLADVKGGVQVVAQNTVLAVLPDGEVEKLLSRCNGKSDNEKVKLQVSGPAYLSGGAVRPSKENGMDRLDYCITVFVENCVTDPGDPV